MFRKFTALVLALLILGSLAGCGEVAGDIAGNVADVAMKELENQVKATFEKYKVDVIELKPVVGKLSGTSGDIQFFCAALVESDSEAVPQSVADALSKIFHDAGITVQTGSKVESPYLEHKELSFKYDGFGDGKTYYAVWCYTDKLPSLEDLKDLKEAVSTEGVG